jgi:hypothetical protein
LAGNFVGRQLGQFGLPLRIVGREDFEARGGQQLFGGIFLGALDSGAAGEDGGREGQGKECFHQPLYCAQPANLQAKRRFSGLGYSQHIERVLGQIPGIGQ